MKSEVITASEEMITEKALAASATSLVPPGAVLVVVRSGILRHTVPVAINAIEVSLNQDMKALRFNASCCDPRFFFRWVQGLNNELILAWSKPGATVESIEHQYLAETVMALPSLPEQHAIVAFLDRETAKIDALVEEQRRLIELLKEKRQAAISHAVTKGLDPTVPMTASGVEWLGEVPAHWDVRRFSHIVQIAEGQVDPRVEPYASMTLIAPNHVESGTGRLWGLETAAAQGADSGKYFFNTGDVLYSKIRPALAKVTLAPCEGLCSADMYPLKPYSCLRAEFLQWLLLSPGFTAWAVLESDRVAMPKINREKLGALQLPLPPTDEQRAIEDSIRQLTSACDPLIQQAKEAVSLLMERRAALISNAVTGKIDVRGVALQQAEAA